MASAVETFHFKIVGIITWQILPARFRGNSLIMRLSMLNPRVGEGGADPGEFDIFTRARVKFPTPGYLANVKFPPLGTTFAQNRS